MKIYPQQESTVQDFIKKFEDKLKEGKAFRVEFSSAEKRSLDQNALFQVWTRQYACEKLGINPKDLQNNTHDRFKLAFKRAFYNYTGYKGLIITGERDPLTDKAVPPRPVSTKDYPPPIMFEFMEYIQHFAGEQGITLEAKGQFLKLKQEQQV